MSEGSPRASFWSTPPSIRERLTCFPSIDSTNPGRYCGFHRAPGEVDAGAVFRAPESHHGSDGGARASTAPSSGKDSCVWFCHSCSHLPDPNQLGWHWCSPKSTSRTSTGWSSGSSATRK
jgi:hypothetical protein